MTELTNDVLLELGFKPILSDGDLCLEIYEEGTSLWHNKGIIFIAGCDTVNFSQAIQTSVKTKDQLATLITLLKV